MQWWESQLEAEWQITLRIFVDTANNGDGSSKCLLSESTPVSIRCVRVCGGGGGGGW